MSLTMVLIVSSLVIIIGQVLRKTVKDTRYFYFSHYLAILGTVFYSIYYANMQDGGVRWPWWFFAMYFVFPISISLLIGRVLQKPKRR